MTIDKHAPTPWLKNADGYLVHTDSDRIANEKQKYKEMVRMRNEEFNSLSLVDRVADFISHNETGQDNEGCSYILSVGEVRALQEIVKEYIKCKK